MFNNFIHSFIYLFNTVALKGQHAANSCDILRYQKHATITENKNGTVSRGQVKVMNTSRPACFSQLIVYISSGYLNCQGNNKQKINTWLKAVYYSIIQIVQS